MTYFPSELKRILSSQTFSESQEEEVRGIDQETKNIALKWLEKHPLALEGSHKVRRVQQLLQEQEGIPVAPSIFNLIFAAQPLSRIAYDPLSAVKKFIEDPERFTLDSRFQEELKKCLARREDALLILLNCLACGAAPLEILKQVFEDRIPDNISAFLEKQISFEELKPLLLLQNRHGSTFLHHPNQLLEFLEFSRKQQVPFEELKPLLLAQNQFDQTPLHHSDGLWHLMKFAKEMQIPLEELKPLLLVQDNHSKTPLHNGALWHLIKFAKEMQIPFEELKPLLLLQDDRRNTPLHSGAVVDLINLAKEMQIPFEELKPFLVAHNQFNETPLHNWQAPRALLEFSKEMQLPFEELKPLLLLQSHSGTIPIRSLDEVRALLEFSKEMQIPFEELKPFWLVQNNHRSTLLHSHRILLELLPLLKELDETALTELFSLQNDEGNTPLHTFPHPEQLEPLLQKLGLEVLEIQNKEGISVRESLLFSLSDAWVEKPKPIVAQEVLSEEEYKARARKVREDLLALWDSLSFGGEAGRVPENYLEAEIKSTLRSCTPEEVGTAFSTMLGRILDKTAWLGTPPAGETEEIHAFYTPMLLNLERIVEKLKEMENSLETAGVLFSIAKVQLEGRCAAAYQGEIEQAAALISESGLELTTEALLEKCATNTLVEIIENIMKDMKSTDVHTYNQLAHVAGLLAAPDPLTPFSVEEAREIIKGNSSFSSILPRIALQFRKIPAEQMIDWLKEKTPESFDGGYLPLKESAHIQEQEILRSTEMRLLEIGVDEERINRILAFFSSPAGTSLSPIATAKTRDEVKSAFAQAIKKTFPLIELREDLLEEHMPQTLDEQSLLAAFNNIRRALSIAPEDSLRWRNTTDAFTKSLLNAERIGKEPFMGGLSLDLQNGILQIKQEYDRQIKSMAEEIEKRIEEEMPLFIKLKECGLPSRGIENSRKMAFAASLFEEGEKGQQLTRGGAIFSAVQIGVLEERLQAS